MNREKFPEFVKYGQIESVIDSSGLGFILRGDVEVFEKVDGGLCQVRNVGGWNLVAGSKANFLKGKSVLGRHPWFGKLNSWMHSNSTLYKLPENYIMFGEWLGNHGIKYDQKNIDSFFVLDVLDLEEDKFIEYEEGRELLNSLGIEGVRYLDVLAKGKVNPSKIDEILYQPSAFYEGEKEGLVIKQYGGKQTFIKLYHQDHAEKEKKGNKIEYLTSVRFEKAIHRLMDGKGAGKVQFAEVVDEVIRDIWAEDDVCVQKLQVSKKLGEMLKERRLRGSEQYLI